MLTNWASLVINVRSEIYKSTWQNLQPREKLLQQTNTTTLNFMFSTM